MATVKVNTDGKAPSGLKAGDQVVTAGGTYRVDGVNADGSYKSSLADKNTTTKNYTGTYDTVTNTRDATSIGPQGGNVNKVTRTDSGSTVTNVGRKTSGNTSSGGSSGTTSTGYTPLVQSETDYDKEHLSAENYATMQAIKNSYAYWQNVGGEEGKQKMATLHDAAQALRQQAGYQALADGSGYIPLANQYEEEEAPEYEGSQWDSVLNETANKLINMNYADWTQGDQYKALADRYGQQGRMSMQDVLGQVSSRTGGLASSYAGTVAQQQYNNYMTQLEEAAQEMYSNERSDVAQNASLANTLAQQDYSRYQDELAQYNTDRAFDYTNWSDWQNRVTAEVERQEAAEQTQLSNLYSKAVQAAEYGDYRYLQALGIDTSDNQQDWERRMQEQEAEWDREQTLWEREYLSGKEEADNAIQWAKVGISQQNANTSATNAATSQARLNETIQQNAATNQSKSFSQMLELAEWYADNMGDYSYLEQITKQLQ